MTFNIITHHGTPRRAVGPNNQVYLRQDALYIPEYQAMVKCTAYDDHFIYHNPSAGESAYKCTCGSPAVIVPPGPGGMLVCLNHATFGFHATSQVNKSDFERGEVVIRKGRKWA